MEEIFVFSQRPMSNTTCFRAKVESVEIGTPTAYVVNNNNETIKVQFPFRLRTPHLLECILCNSCFHIEFNICENEIVSIHLMIDTERFVKEIQDEIVGEVHLVGLAMDVWRDSHKTVEIKNDVHKIVNESSLWNEDYPLYNHQKQSVGFIQSVENGSGTIQYEGNIVIGSTGWYIDTENECLTTDPSWREAQSKGGILADGTGTGKTATILYSSLSNVKKPVIRTNNYTSKATLLIVPINLVGQWIDEVNKFCDMKKLKFVNFYSNKDLKTTQMDDLLEADFVLTTLHFIRTSKCYCDMKETAFSKINVSGKYSNIKTVFSSWSRSKRNTEPILECVYWNRIVVDEIHMVFESQRDLRHLKQFISEFCWGLTATPDIQTENSQNYYWLLRREKAHHPNLLHNLLQNSIYGIPSNIEGHELNLNLVQLNVEERLYLQTNESHMTTTEIIKLLSFINTSDDSFVCFNSSTIEEDFKLHKKKEIEMLQAQLVEHNNSIKIIDNAAKELENQITILSEKKMNDTIIAQIEVAKTSSEQHYKDMLKFKEMRDSIASKIERNIHSMNFVSERLTLLKSQKQICQICMDKQCSVIIPCGHLYCSQCIKKTLKMNSICPECRVPFNYDCVRTVKLGGEIGSKMIEISNLIAKINEPIILFVQWKSMIRGMKSFLKGLCIKILSLEGNVTQRSTTLDEFKKGGVLILCLEDSFAGLHLPHARYVIFSHAIVGDVKSVQTIERQAIARCVRHGQTEIVKVYSFIVSDCDEEHIWRKTH